MLRFSLIYHRRTTKTCSVFLPFTSVYRPNRPVTGPYRAVYRSKPIEFWRFNLDFEFVRFWSVTAAYQPVYRNRWPAVRWTGKVNPAVPPTLLAWPPPLRVSVQQCDAIQDRLLQACAMEHRTSCRLPVPGHPHRRLLYSVRPVPRTHQQGQGSTISSALASPVALVHH
jgi:hypothetical protein